MSFGKRWYDNHPKVSVAVGCIEQADEKLRTTLAKVIIKQAMNMGVTAKKPCLSLFRRWYDKDPDLCLAMEYFKNCNDKQRIDIAETIITYVKNTTVR